jgi:catechol 2,3-dioxygenase-like lactoylglutathione lyase family enzyme
MIDHVYISVTNIDKSLAFYSKALKSALFRSDCV